MTAEEAAKLSIRQEGVYGFEVADAKDGTSREKSNPMIALTLSFFDEEGSRFTVKDWLVHSESRWAEKKFFDFAETAQLHKKYADGSMRAEDCLGRSGFAMLVIEKGKPKSDGSGNFPDRNAVKYYTTKGPEKRSEPKPAAVSTPAGSTPSSPAKQNENLDEDVPF